MKNTLTLATTICFLFASAPANAQCEDVSVPGVHVNPFNMNELILHAFNENESEIFDYPGWRLYDESGVLIAEEQVQFFGIFGNSIHSLNIIEPLDYSVQSFYGTLELWTGFYDVLECSYDLEVFPWRVDESTDEPYGCIPIGISLQGLSEEGASIEISITDGNASSVFEETYAMEAGSFGGYVGATCLDQEQCYYLSITSEDDIDNMQYSMLYDSEDVYFFYVFDQIGEDEILLNPFGQGECECNFTPAVAASNTGEWGEEMSWELYGPEPNSENLVASFQGVDDDINSLDTLCLEPGCYAFVMYDSWGDGWNGGSLTLELPEMDITISLEDGYIGYETFDVEIGTTDCAWELPGCTNPSAENYTVGATIDDGTCYIPEVFFTSEDVERSYYLYTPEGLDDDAPLVFVLHGYWGTNMEMSSFSGMNEIADAEGFAVCYPQGLPDYEGVNHWNANLIGISNVNDVLFLTELAEFLQVEHGFSSDCTYSCGYSNGGYMSYTLACEAPDVFRGIGSVGGTMSGYDFENCTPTLVPVVHLHGTDDNVVSYYSTNANPNNPWNGADGVEAVVLSWANANNCSQTSITALPDLDPADGSNVVLVKHTDGDFGYQAWVYRVIQGGHDWFGEWGNMDIHSSAVIWSFLSTFCGTTISTDDLTPDNGQLFTYTYSSASNQIELHGLENTTCQIFDSSGRLVTYLPLFSGQTKLITLQSSGLFTIISRSSDLNITSIQREKVVLR